MDWLAANGVLCLPTGPQRLRLVLHADIDDAKLDKAIEVFRGVANALY